MGKPITWQNVNGPSLADAAAPMAAAQRSFDTAFSRLGDELVRRQATQDANFAQAKANNTEAFLAQLSQFRTPEELAAAQQEGGALDILTKRFGGQVDQAAIRQAQDLRPGVLQERIGKENQFKDAQLDREQAPTRDAILAAINGGDVLTANSLMSGAPNLRNVAPLEAARMQAQRNAVLAARGDSDAAHLAAKRPLEIKELNNRIDAQAAEAALRPKLEADRLAEREAQRKRQEAADAAAKLTAAEKAREAARLRLTQGTPLEGGDLRSNAGMTKVQEAMSKLKDVTPENVNEMYAAIERVAPGGMITLTRNGKATQLPVPVGVVIQAMQGAYDSWSPGSDHGDAVEAAVRKAMSAPALQDKLIEVESNRILFEAANAAPGTEAPAANPAPALAPPVAPNPAALLRQEVVTNVIGPRRLKMLQDAKELHLRRGDAVAARSVDEQIARETGAKK